jgi:plastocyanin
MKNTIIVLVVLVIVASATYFLVFNNSSSGPTDNYQTPPTANDQTPNPTPVLPPTTITPPSPAAPEARISIRNFAFQPATLTVKAGTVVIWFNNDTVTHTVIADSGQLLHSANLAAGQSYQVTLTKTGSISYHCSIHPMMKGRVIVN